MKAWHKEYSELSTRQYFEQIVYRMSQEQCWPCIEKGECVHCGCKSPELFFDRSNDCSGGSWFEMIPAEMWDAYKKESGIEIDPDYAREIKKYGRIVNFKK